MSKRYSFIMFLLLLSLFYGCSDSDNNDIQAPVISGIEDKYIISVNDNLELDPVITNDNSASYSWLLDDKEVSTTRKYTFKPIGAGKNILRLRVTNSGGAAEKSIELTVNESITKITITSYTILTLEMPSDLAESKNVKWTVLSTPSELYRLSYPETKSPVFIAAKEGQYYLQVTDGTKTDQLMIEVQKNGKQLSSFIANVFDYLPAPGQFVNELPKYEDGDTHEDMVKKVGEWIIGEDAYMITLGGWGGYVTFGFDHTIVNVSGKRDFRVRGNAFGANDNKRPNAPFGGSCEPGIIMVAYDKNKNGKPDDDEWYEIRGSSSFSAEQEPWYAIAKENGNDTKVFRNYEMTYYRPTKEKSEISGKPDDPNAYMTIQNYIHWKDNQGNEGYKVKNVYHTQTYYPAWIKQDKITYKGVRLPENGINEGKFNPGVNQGSTYFVLYGFRYGYVDNYPNVDNNSAIDIDWAIDKNGNKVDLPGIDFVKVYCGVNQENGWLGECSTEVERGEDLHMLGLDIETIKE